MMKKGIMIMAMAAMLTTGTCYAQESPQASQNVWTKIHYTWNGNEIENVYLESNVNGIALSEDGETSYPSMQAYLEKRVFSFMLIPDGSLEPLCNQGETAFSNPAYVKLTGMQYETEATLLVDKGSSEWFFSNDDTVEGIRFDGRDATISDLIAMELQTAGTVEIRIPMRGWRGSNDNAGTWLSFSISGGNLYEVLPVLDKNGWKETP